jgi:hypothetical protein
VKFAKGPVDEISPNSLLKDMFKYLRCESDSRDLGIVLERLFYERSKISNPFKYPKDCGMSP